MKKFVFLFELDSVRKTDKEIEIGQNALYNEIIRNGNIVVITFNQFVDSRGFFSLLNNQEYYDNLILLFQSGAIRISQFEDIRTISQYLLSSLEYEKEFFYSGWPLKSTQKRLLALIKRSLIYSDLSEIKDYCGEKRSDKEIADLFVEIDSNKGEKATSFNPEECRLILRNLYGLIKTVLRLSTIDSIYISPRNINEYANLKLYNIIENIGNLSCVQKDDKLNSALNIIKELPCYGSNSRSKYLHDLLVYYDTHDNANRNTCQLAEAVINISYNYACEISICNISKHYDVGELTNLSGEKITFETDFRTRLDEYWNIGDYDNRFLLRETNEYEEYTPPKRFPAFSTAARVNSYASKEEDNHPTGIPRYEDNLARQRLRHKYSILASIGRRVAFSIICFFIAFGVEILLQLIQNALDDIVNLSNLWWIAIETFTIICATEILSSCIASLVKKLFNVDFLTFSEALGEIGRLLHDAGYIMIEKTETHFNPCLKSRNTVEHFNEAVSIDLVKSESLKRYLNLRKTPDNSLFAYSDIYPIANTEDNSVIRNLLRYEETHNCQFGVVYKSKYNTLIVDPIEQKTEETTIYYPYERIIPTSGVGIVMVTKFREKFVVLKQYRHAPRKIQYSFPRGFGKDGILPIDNAEKELKEEINAKITKIPMLLGRICPDSGLTSSCVYVYLVDVDSYEKTHVEGILDVIELSSTELENRINSNLCCDENDFDDGFTVAAYMLYKSQADKRGRID